MSSIVGVGACADADYHVAQAGAVVQCPRRANTDSLLHIVKMEQLIGINPDRGHSHAATHNGDALALPGTGKCQHVADGVHADRVLQERFRYEFRPQRVSGHQHGRRDFAQLCANMRGWNLTHHSASFSYRVISSQSKPCRDGSPQAI